MSETIISLNPDVANQKMTESINSLSHPEVDQKILETIDSLNHSEVNQKIFETMESAPIVATANTDLFVLSQETSINTEDFNSVKTKTSPDALKHSRCLLDTTIVEDFHNMPMAGRHSDFDEEFRPASEGMI